MPHSAGANLRTQVKITFEEACFGTEKEIEIPSKVECKTCGGSGAKAGTSPVKCERCGGRGQIVQTQQSLFGMVQNVTTCPACGGKGTIIKEKCPDCHGQGYTSKKEKLQVSIPAGIDHGQSVRLRGKGEPGKNGGARGDLLVEVYVERHKDFRAWIMIFTQPYGFLIQELFLAEMWLSRQLMAMSHTM